MQMGWCCNLGTKSATRPYWIFGLPLSLGIVECKSFSYGKIAERRSRECFEVITAFRFETAAYSRVVVSG